MTGELFLYPTKSLADLRRLSYYNLETRDAYFTRLMAKIELMRKHNGRKVVLCSHS